MDKTPCNLDFCLPGLFTCAAESEESYTREATSARSFPQSGDLPSCQSKAWDQQATRGRGPSAPGTEHDDDQAEHRFHSWQLLAGFRPGNLPLVHTYAERLARGGLVQPQVLAPRTQQYREPADLLVRRDFRICVGQQQKSQIAREPRLV